MKEYMKEIIKAMKKQAKATESTPIEAYNRPPLSSKL
jgi:hypothetical protein